MTYLLIGIGGFAGSLLRYGVGGLYSKAGDGEFPASTLCINLSGSFILVFLLTVTNGEGRRNESIRLAFGTGLMGAYTTFSAFSAETFGLFQAGEWLTGFFYVMASAAGGLSFALLGWKTGNAVNRHRQGGRS